ncbi:prolyl 4-hydroxylase subunit alpha-2 [Drosophila serrata]|uniref:prolyl 4-hydroxylase subunit alpha-2 n=1 Tax=Drosophila serrata TaxID=7274 RepID=UPI000A1D3822|nr:prolyl 4-hydroxylase subunit alpha-2 [Drosophila serrata]
MQNWKSLVVLFLLWRQIIAENIQNPLNNEGKQLYSSSNAGLLKLLQLEQRFMENIKIYTNKLTEKVKNLQAFIDSVDYRANETFEDREKYVSNPLNAFSLLRRTHEDLPKWHNYTQQMVGMEELYALEEIAVKAPDEEDMNYSLQGMHRLEKIYGLEATDLARGRIQDRKYDVKMSARDCFALGEHKYQKEDYQRASMWFRMALKHKPEENAKLVNEILGDMKDKLRKHYAASIIIFGLVKSDPTLTIAKSRAIAFEALGKATLTDLKTLITELLKQSDEEIVREMNINGTAPSDYELGCRGLLPKRKNLYCSYDSSTTPFLRIAPTKQEIISLDPYIVMHHEVLYNNEIAELKLHAQNKIKVTNENRMKIDSLRRRMINRITDITGVGFQITHELHMPDYDLKSYYKPNRDYAYWGGPKVTLLFFASDVEGGATVFTKSKVSVFPRKGSSLFWYNLLDDGTPDRRSVQAECPVLKGNKWVFTKWIKEINSQCTHRTKS